LHTKTTAALPARMTPFLSKLLAFALASVRSSSTQEKTTRKQNNKQSKGHRAPAMANPCHKQNPISFFTNFLNNFFFLVIISFLFLTHQHGYEKNKLTCFFPFS
jgi:hypothetical protein